MIIISVLSHKIVSFNTKTYYLLGFLFFIPLLGKAQNWTLYLSTKDVYSIAIDAQGNKWVGTYNGGVSKYDGTTWTNYNTSNTNGGLAGNTVKAIAIDAQGNKWFGTDGGGVSKLIEIKTSLPIVKQIDVLDIYPNPSRDPLNIVWHWHQQEKMSFEIYDLMGRRVQALSVMSTGASSQKTDIPLEKLSAGVYF